MLYNNKRAMRPWIAHLSPRPESSFRRSCIKQVFFIALAANLFSPKKNFLNNVCRGHYFELCGKLFEFRPVVQEMSFICFFRF